ncbi:glyoxylase-like metal-dependent hydrolase (beta-lactamase superfamily II) [Rhizobium sp. SG_E_25_P2]|uniref:MBL fold metallo-hydrolase n=1 Tax=Rhizobium sp. SG_E_25_P2 TaxID=2879942 RepID=UPI002473F97F|nr:MBL fold metallo-hydrolase [Rhizobium sp. SG_E_25_P2]MDH6265681.1 glyoxylase-like metal-dependent hydrolase (beta-lactamase superfamily II) [Rhizobium sp. SG_E_25_P2]
MTILTISRRSLFATAATGALAAPAILTTSLLAAAPAAAQAAPAAMPRFNSFKFGAMDVTVISDGTRAADKPNETFGTNQKPEDVAALLTANFLPTDKFVNGFSPVLVKTGADLILFDTGMGEGGREWGAGQLRAGIQAAGYKPEDVTLVVITHMHGDHISGLMEGGKPAFANARYVFGEAEFAFWKDTARMGTPAENGHKGVMKNIAPLAEKATFVKDNADVAPGVTGMAAFGHSPGHMIYRLESEGQTLILTADTANHFVLSLQRPDWEVKFDMDKAKAAEARKRVFDMIATDRLAFIGYHMPFPAVGYVEKQGEGYRYNPATYQFAL